MDVDILGLQKLNVCWRKVGENTGFGIDSETGKRHANYQLRITREVLIMYDTNPEGQRL